MCELGFESLARRFRPCRITADGDHAVADLKKLRRLGSPLLEIAEQPREKNQPRHLAHDKRRYEGSRPQLPSTRPAPGPGE